MSSRKDLDRIFRGLIELEGIVNHTRGVLGPSLLFEDDSRKSIALDKIAGLLISARAEIRHLCEMDLALAKLRRGGR